MTRTRVNGPRTAIGDVSGRLTVVDPGPYYEENTTRRQKRIVARCECGDERRYDEYRFVSGRAVQCPPCAYSQRGLGISNVQSGWDNWLYSYMKNAKSRGIAWSLSVLEFTDLCKRDCFYCGESPQRRTHRRNPIFANGVDRLDSTRGYIASNCVSCCSTCNKMKGTMGVDEFLAQIERIFKLKR